VRESMSPNCSLATSIERSHRHAISKVLITVNAAAFEPSRGVGGRVSGDLGLEQSVQHLGCPASGLGDLQHIVRGWVCANGDTCAVRRTAVPAWRCGCCEHSLSLRLWTPRDELSDEVFASRPHWLWEGSNREVGEVERLVLWVKFLAREVDDERQPDSVLTRVVAGN
jgi:hypothetical protein